MLFAMGTFDLFAKYAQNDNMLCKTSFLALLTLVFNATDSEKLTEDSEYYGGLWNEYPNAHGHEYKHSVQDELEFTHAYMTPYRWLAPQSTRAPKPPGCEAVQLYLVAR